jgi:hypothetical protein
MIGLIYVGLLVGIAVALVWNFFSGSDARKHRRDQTLKGLKEGLTLEQIAKRTGMPVRTVRYYIQSAQ